MALQQAPINMVNGGGIQAADLYGITMVCTALCRIYWALPDTVTMTGMDTAIEREEEVITVVPVNGAHGDLKPIPMIVIETEISLNVILALFKARVQVI